MHCCTERRRPSPGCRAKEPNRRGVVCRYPRFGLDASKVSDECGQATVEAAFALPVLGLLLLLLLQPGLILYDRMVMEAAASEACRMLATKTDAAGPMDEAVRAAVLHRLGAIPPVACFHVHDGDECSWAVELAGDEGSGYVSARIENQVRPLPLLGAAASLLGLVNEEGNLVVRVERSALAQPEWIDGADAGRIPALWIGGWFQ